MNRPPQSTGSYEAANLKVLYSDPDIQSILVHRLLFYLHQARNMNLVVVCVGTDRSTGDSLGPLVGTSLSKLHSPLFHLYGTLDEPVHAINLQSTLDQISQKHHNPYVIGIDACLGQSSSVGCIQVTEGPLRPGAGVNKELPPVGDIHLTGIVNVGGFMEYFVLQNTRLNLVVKLADVISSSLYTAIKEWSYHYALLTAQEQ